MIRLEQVTARAAPIALGPLTLHLRAGISALLGAKSDGISLVLDVIAARVKIRAGRASILGHVPDAPAARRAVAYVPLDAVLPDALRVSETLDLAKEIRGDNAGDALDRLRALGIESLAGRRLRTLGAREVRAVALCEALTSKTVRIVLIEEPFSTIDARAAAALPDLLRQRAKEGACIVIGTASPRDARDLTDAHFVLERGLYTERRPMPQRELHIVASDVRRLAGALTHESAIAEIVANDDHVIVRGTDASGMAQAVGRAVIASGVDLESMRFEPPALESP